MKTGATNPFADDDQDDEPDEPASVTEQSDPEPEAENPEPSTSNTSQFDRSDLPLILARDSVKDDRDDVHQLFVYEETFEKEKTARRVLEDRIGDDLYKVDVREAIYLAGMQTLDDAESILREWGADI